MLLGARSAGGVVKITVSTGGENYSVVPRVIISGGGGTGASGVAIMQGTRVGSVLLTNAGTGYTGAPTVSFSPTVARTVEVCGNQSNFSILCLNTDASTAYTTVQQGGISYPIESWSSSPPGQAFVASSAITDGAVTLLGAGSGAAATASANTSAFRPMSFFKGRYADVYGVDGMGRGVRWDGAASTLSPIGIVPPHGAPSVTIASSGVLGGVRAVQIASAGQGYGSEPRVVFTGGSPTKTARGRAILANGRVSQVRILDAGAGYKTTPSVGFVGGFGTGASFGVTVSGRIATIEILNPGSGYSRTQAPTLTFSQSRGLQDAYAKFTVDSAGKLDGVVLLSAGTGATTSGVSGSVSASIGSGATVQVHMRYTVTGVTVSNSGSKYFAPPTVSFRAATGDVQFIDAAATAFVNTTGNITGVTVYSGGEYTLPPTATILDTPASAQADLKPPFQGAYKCAVRYIDGTPASQGGPRASSISALAEINADSGFDSMTWFITHGAVDDRVSAMELWRTTSDQSILLFRVATITRTNGTWAASTYLDTLSDYELSNPERDGYALMPITLPSGQINARRFDVPPGEFAVGCMFQDRAWYAVDATGARPNALVFSEVDEPESVPAANELVIQENTGDPDKVVGLVPLGSMLLVAQQSHLYRLTYVAQPAIDAAIALVGYRGLLNNRCWDVMGGVAFLVDSAGMYAFDGNSEEALSVAVDDFWRDRTIDFSKSEKFHVRADIASRTVRFFYCQSGDSEPTRALCYCVATKAWWEEQFATAVTATCPVVVGGRRAVFSGLSSGGWQSPSSTSSESISYSLRTGAFPLGTEDGDRTVAVIYDPTTNDSTINLRLHYNNSSAPRANAIAMDRGSGFTTEIGSTGASLNMKKTRSPLGDATGFAAAKFNGRVTPESAGGDRAVAIALDGAQTATDPMRLHAIVINGAG